MGLRRLCDERLVGPDRQRAAQQIANEVFRLRANPTRTGVYSTDISIKAGMDLEMPGPGVFRGDQIRRQMSAGKLAEYDLDLCVKSVSARRNACPRQGHTLKGSSPHRSSSSQNSPSNLVAHSRPARPLSTAMTSRRSCAGLPARPRSF